MSAPLRLWHQSMTELDLLPSYRQALESRSREVLGERVVVDVHGLEAGSYGGRSPSDVLGFPYASHLVLRQAIDAARRAESSGYDGFVIGSFSEPFLREIRSAVDLPVASMAESTLLVACSLGARVALVANAPSVAGLVRDAVEKHHLGARVASVTSLGADWTEDHLEAADPPTIATAFVEAAAREVAAGADVVVPAEGVLAGVVHAAALAKVAGAPLVDSLAVTWLHAEMLVRIAATGVGASRLRYPKAPESMVEDLRAAELGRLTSAGKDPGSPSDST